MTAGQNDQPGQWPKPDDTQAADPTVTYGRPGAAPAAEEQPGGDPTVHIGMWPAADPQELPQPRAAPPLQDQSSQYPGTQHQAPPHQESPYPATQNQATHNQATQYSGAQHPGTQYPGTQYLGVEQPTGPYSGAQYQGASQHPGAQYQGAQYQGAQYQGAQYQGAQYPGAQYPGAQYQAPPYPGAPPYPAPPAAQARPGRWKIPAIVAVVVLLLAGGGAGGYYFYDRAQRTVTLLGFDKPGADPFGPNLAPGGGALPTVAFDMSAGRTPSGDVEGLYWDTNGKAGCDRAQLGTLLAGDPTLAAAWALPLGPGAANVAGFVATLTPVRLRADTRLTAHRYSGGRAEPYAATLQAGTAVLVDDRGVPRVRCADASPLAGSEAVQDPYYGGEQWPGFAPSGLLEVRPAGSAIAEFGLVGVAGDQPFRRPAGATGETDFGQTPETGRLDGDFALSGAQTSCEGVDCAASTQHSLTPRFRGCPAQCTVSERDLGDAVTLTRNGSTWGATGPIRVGRGILCGTEDVPTTFAVTITPVAAAVVDGVWTATQLRADLRVTSPETAACVATAQAWTMSGGVG